MSDTRELLQEEELEFLLNETQVAEDTESNEDQLPGDGEITMAGDLDKIDLADIFQTLAMSKMEGQLRVRNLVEKHELFFQDGLVRSIPPQRTEIKRIGQRLLHAGLLSIEQLRIALLSQKRESQQGSGQRHLGEILVDEGFVTQDDIEDIFFNQVQEDLFALFTWQHGSFEFYRGACNDPEINARLEQTPKFEVNGVLLEVARRGDEWQRVLDAVGNLDEILEVIPDIVPEEPLDDAYETVLASINGERNVRSIADHTALGLFTCGCIIRDLTSGGFLRPVATEDALAIAEDQCSRGDLKIATVTYQMIRARAETPSTEVAMRLAKGLQRCGETRWAGRVLIAAARHESDPDEALRVARFARKCAARSSQVLSFLQYLLKNSGADPQELIEVTSDLADAHLHNGEMEEALAAVGDLEELAPDSPVALNRKARILARLGHKSDAINTFLQLAEHFKEPRLKDRLIATYEQILKLDYQRKDVARALRGLRRNKNVVRLRIAVTALVIGGAAAWSYASYFDHVTNIHLESVRDAALAKIAEGDFNGARGLVAQAQMQHPDTQMFGEVTRRINAHNAREAATQRAAVEEACGKALADANNAIAQAQISRALEIYESLTEFGKTRDEIEKIMLHRLEAVLTQLDLLKVQLHEKLPPRPNLLQSYDDHLRLVEEANANFQTADRDLAAAVVEDGTREKIESILDLDKSEKMFEAANSIVQMFANCEEIVAAHRHEIDRTRTAQRLTPLFEAARRYEDTHEFSKALEAYRRLSREHPEEDELKASFRERVERYATIQRFIQVLEKATERGDFATAQGKLRALQQAYPDIPFAELLSLPVRVSTTPPGAKVFIDGRHVGNSPVLSKYFPGRTVRVRIELTGFRVEETEFEGDRVSNVRSLLAKKPAWQLELGSTTEIAPVLDTEGIAVFVDREGNVTAIDTKANKRIWRKETEDMSGLLPRPVLLPNDAVAVASVDGTLRCFDRRNGEIRWKVDNISTDVPPACASDTIVIATKDDRLVGLSARDGDQLFAKPLDKPVRAGLTTLNAQTAIVATTGGEVLAVELPSGAIAWRRDVGSPVFVAPSTHSGFVCVVTEDGELVVLDEAGKPAWTRAEFRGVELSPASDGKHVFVANDATLHRLDLATGANHREYTAPQRICAPPAAFGGHVFVGRDDGAFEVLDGTRLEALYLLRHVKRSLAPVVPNAAGTGVIATFSDGTIQEFASIHPSPGAGR